MISSKRLLLAIFIVGAVFFALRKPLPEAAVETPEAVDSISETSVPVTELEAKIMASPTPAHVDSTLTLIKEILAKNDDNDPRLDHELKVLTTEMRESIRELYRTLPKESLNQRGTLIFLLGRNIESSNDLAFLGDILNEEPCGNLTNCEEPLDLKPDLHAETSTMITLAYPQLVALYSLDTFIEQNPDHPLRADADVLIRQAANSRVKVISLRAQGIQDGGE